MLQLRPLKLVVSSLLHRDDEKHHRRRVAILGTSQQYFREYIVFNVAASASSVFPSENNAPDSIPWVENLFPLIGLLWRQAMAVCVQAKCDSDCRLVSANCSFSEQGLGAKQCV